MEAVDDFAELVPVLVTGLLEVEDLTDVELADDLPELDRVAEDELCPDVEALLEVEPVDETGVLLTGEEEALLLELETFDETEESVTTVTGVL